MFETVLNAYKGYANYLWNEISLQSSPWWKNYFWWLIFISLIFFVLEALRPWRKEQALFRKDFWLDFFYMFFNFFLFSLVVYNAASTLVVDFINHAFLTILHLDLKNSNPMNTWPYWSILLVGFVVRDFVQFNVHRLLHAHPRLWRYHQVHHSVEQMGFAAHLRYHWMETIVYRSIEYLPLALLGIGLHDFFIIHLFTIAVGHYNHTNFRLSSLEKGLVFGAFIGFFVGAVALELGAWPLLASIGLGALGGMAVHPIWKYIFNSPELHIWHHAYHLPEGHDRGINFAITLAIWDYIFGTAVIPHDGRDIPLGFPGLEQFPRDFLEQNSLSVGKQG
jgi:sterol desaturase/sphingolipid hydroxylase (fatty acid hydroxylase superfamily)